MPELKLRHLQQYAVEYKNQGLLSRTWENHSELIWPPLCMAGIGIGQTVYYKGIEKGKIKMPTKTVLWNGAPHVALVGIMAYLAWDKSSTKAAAEKAGLTMIPNRVILNLETEFDPKGSPKVLTEIFPASSEDDTKFAIGTRQYLLEKGDIFVQEGSEKYGPHDELTTKEEAEEASRLEMLSRELIPVEASEVVNRMGHFIQGTVRGLKTIKELEHKEIDDMLKFLTAYMNQTRVNLDPVARFAIKEKIYQVIEENIDLLTDVQKSTFEDFKAAYGLKKTEEELEDSETRNEETNSGTNTSRNTALKTGHDISADELDKAIDSLQSKLKLIEAVSKKSGFYDINSTNRTEYKQVVAAALDYDEQAPGFERDIALDENLQTILEAVIEKPIVDAERSPEGRYIYDLPTALYDLKQARAALD